MVTRLLWLLSVKHATVNYPVSDYGAFTPLLPTKIFNDTRVPPGDFSILNLPNSDISSVSVLKISMSQQIMYFHFINLFTCNHKFYDDYYYNLSSYSAEVLVIFNKSFAYVCA